MKMKMALCIWLISLSLFACKEEVTEIPINPESIWECHHTTEWDAIKSRDALLGNWQWVFYGCYFKLIHEEDVTDQNITIEFKPDSTLIVRTNDVITQESSWYVVEGFEEYFELTVNPPVVQIGGIIFICDNKAEFRNSYRDGCNKHFERKG